MFNNNYILKMEYNIEKGWRRKEMRRHRGVKYEWGTLKICISFGKIIRHKSSIKGTKEVRMNILMKYK